LNRKKAIIEANKKIKTIGIERWIALLKMKYEQ